MKSEKYKKELVSGKGPNGLLNFGDINNCIKRLFGQFIKLEEMVTKAREILIRVETS